VNEIADRGPVEAGPLRALKSLIRAIDGCSYWVVIATTAAMTILVSLQVFYRYALSSSIDSADELSRLFFIWAIFLAVPHGIKFGIHVGIDLIVRMLPLSLQEFMFRLSCGLGAILMIVTFVVSWTATMDKWPELMPTLPITAAVYYIPVLISAGHSFIHLVALTWGGANTWAGENDL